MKKFLALLLCLALMLALTPAAFADEMPEEDFSGWADDDFGDYGEYDEDQPDEPPDESFDDPGDETGEETDDPEEDDGLEYGVMPADEMPEEELPEDAWQDDGTAGEPQSVLVTFLCDPPETHIVVYDGNPLADGSWKAIGTVSGGTIVLLPGDYAYDAYCEGYCSESKTGFFVSDPGPAGTGALPEQYVTVSLFPLDEEESYETGEPLRERSTPPDPLVVLPVEPGADRRTPTVFLQEDSRWAASPYGYRDGTAAPIADSGCGLLALTNAVYYLNGSSIEPAFAAEYAAGAGFHEDGGTRWEFYRSFAETWGKSYGIQYVGEANNYTDLKDMVLSGCAAICCVPGHFMALVDYDETLGRYLLLDSSPDEVRATEKGYVWISEKELCAMPSQQYEYEGLILRFVLLRAAGVLDVNAVLDGTASAALDGYGTFDVWIDGEKAADDQEDYCAELPHGASYRIDDIRPGGAYRYYGLRAGALEGVIESGTEAEIVLGFGTRDFVSEPVAESSSAPAAVISPPAVCTHWIGGIIGPAVSLRFP